MLWGMQAGKEWEDDAMVHCTAADSSSAWQALKSSWWAYFFVDMLPMATAYTTPAWRWVLNIGIDQITEAVYFVDGHPFVGRQAVFSYFAQYRLRGSNAPGFICWFWRYINCLFVCLFVYLPSFFICPFLPYFLAFLYVCHYLVLIYFLTRFLPDLSTAFGSRPIPFSGRRL